jgi:Putative integrase
MIIKNLEEQFDKWSNIEGVCKVEFSLSKLNSGLGFISNRPISYNATLDTIAVDTNKLEQIGDLASYLESKIKARFTTLVCEKINRFMVGFDDLNLSSKKIIQSPFNLFHFKFLSDIAEQDRKEKAYEFIKLTVENNFANLNVGLHPKKSPACALNIIETFKDFSDHEITKYICYLAQRAGYKFSSDGRAISRYKKDGFTDINSIVDTPLINILPKLAFHLDPSVNYKNLELFESEYFCLGEEGQKSRTTFSDTIERISFITRELMFELADSKIIILPFSFKKENLPPDLISNLPDSALKTELMTANLLETKDKHQKRSLKDFYSSLSLSSNCKSMVDFPESLARDVSEVIRELHKSRGYNTSKHLPYKVLRELFDELETRSNWTKQVGFKKFNRSYLSETSMRRILNSDNERKSLKLGWAKGLIPESLFEEVSTYTASNCNKKTIGRVNHFVDWYISLSDEYKGEINRIVDFNVIMFKDPLFKFSDKTFYDYLDGVEAGDSTIRTIWSTVHQMFEHVINASRLSDNKAYANPFPESKKVFLATPVNSQTTRAAMPSVIHKMALDILKKDDYQFAKDNLPKSTLSLLNKETGIRDSVFAYNIPYILHILLILPLRLHQVRWLDEGLLDSLIWDITSGAFIKNTHPLAGFRYPDGEIHSKKYNQTGVFSSEQAQGNENLNLYINTNKTKGYSLQKKGYTGYTIPWPHDCDIEDVVDVYNILEKQRVFNNSYSPLDIEPVKVIDEDSGKYDAKVWVNLPYFTPLFRDLLMPRVSDADTSRTNLHLPTKADNVRTLFKLLMKEAEKQYKETYPQYADHIVVFDEDENCLFDVHTLRVFGITDLLDRGLDKEIVKILVGHNTSIMTLYYHKRTEAMYRKLFLESKKKAGVATENELLYLEFGLRDGEALIDLFSLVPEWQSDKFPRPDMTKGGKPKVMKGGVCDSFDCETGGINIKYTRQQEVFEISSVEGGALRCGNCRYWKTGPRFLLEQIYYLNEVASEVEELVHQRIDFLTKSQEAFNHSDYKRAEIISEKFSQKADEVTALLAHRVQELKRRDLMLSKTFEVAKLDSKNNQLPIEFGTISDPDDLKWESMGVFDAAMERTTQAAVLGIVGEENTISMIQLEKFCTKFASLSKNSNPLLFVPNDEVKRAAILYKLSSITKELGRSFDDDEFDDPRVLLSNLGEEKFMQLGQSLTSLEADLLQLEEKK